MNISFLSFGQKMLPNMPDNNRRQYIFTFFIATLIFIESLFLLSLQYENLHIGKFLNPLASKNDGKSIKTQSINLNSALTDKNEKQGNKSFSPINPEDVKENTLDNKSVFNILILGIDRRHALDNEYRSDVNMILSLSADRKKVVVTSIPRDLWLEGSRINAFITTAGVEKTKEIFSSITGLKIDRYIQLDFDAFVEGIDALGGVEVNVERGFTDVGYPNDREGRDEVITVTFNQGQQILNGERALIFSRSRKGDNGEGSDFMRMRRQQKVLKSLPTAFFSPKCIFNPFVLENFYTAVKNKFKTDFSIKDVSLAYELLKSHDKVVFEHLVLDTNNYLYNPPMAEYGGAYVLRPNDENFSEIKKVLAEKLGLK